MTGNDWFKNWFRSMPPEWQQGLTEISRGEATVFCGNVIGRDGRPTASIMFMPPGVADTVQAFLEGRLEKT